MKALIISLVFLVSPAFADEALLKKHMCIACHNVNVKVVGPAYKDVAKKYRNQEDANTYLSGKIINGSKGVWGPVPMLPNTKVTEQEAKKLADYILGLK